MKRPTKRRHAVHRLNQKIRNVEKRQNRLVGEVLRAVTHLLEEYVPVEPVPGPKKRH